jgi:hypothetical protein
MHGESNIKFKVLVSVLYICHIFRTGNKYFFARIIRSSGVYRRKVRDAREENAFTWQTSLL